jgi:hypothetical protein
MSGEGGKGDGVVVMVVRSSVLSSIISLLYLPASFPLLSLPRPALPSLSLPFPSLSFPFLLSLPASFPLVVAKYGGVVVVKMVLVVGGGSGEGRKGQVVVVVVDGSKEALVVGERRGLGGGSGDGATRVWVMVVVRGAFPSTLLPIFPPIYLISDPCIHISLPPVHS